MSIARKLARLFDIESDPLERDDLAGTQRERVAGMAARRSELCGGGRRRDADPTEMDETTQQKLRALGYVQ